MNAAAIVGTGLIGGSLGGALRRNGWYVRGTDVDLAALQEARGLGLIDDESSDLASCVRDVDVVLLAVPVGRVIDLLPEVDVRSPTHALIVDTGSVKQPIVAAMESLGGSHRAVGGHPLAGDHRSGPGAANEDLFCDRPFYLCPSARTSEDALSRARSLVQSLGARPHTLAATDHDRKIAASSHMPQVLSSLLASQDVDPDFAGSGFRDMTRLAGSDPAMWRDILLYNRGDLLEALASFRSSLDALMRALTECDAEAVEHVIKRGRARVPA